jgi:hypothetical protein
MDDRLRYVLLTIIVMALCPAVATGQQSASQGGPLEVDVRMGAIVSVQPGGYESSGSPYLDHNLGGTEPGVVVGFELSSPARPLLAVELSTTTYLQAVQSGRFVIGLGPALARHRDTLISVLSGFHVPVRRGGVELKAGISFLIGTPKREPVIYEDPAGAFAFTTGIDAVAAVGNRLAIVPSFRYSYADRGQDAFYYGLGNHITRFGAALRIKLATR